MFIVINNLVYMAGSSFFCRQIVIPAVFSKLVSSIVILVNRLILRLQKVRINENEKNKIQILCIRY